MVEQQGLAAGTVHEQLLASAGLPVAANRKEAPSSLSLSLSLSLSGAAAGGWGWLAVLFYLQFISDCCSSI
jgi:hypothetical protein